MGKDKAVRSGSGSLGPLFCNLYNNAGNCKYMTNLNNILLCPY